MLSGKNQKYTVLKKEKKIKKMKKNEKNLKKKKLLLSKRSTTQLNKYLHKTRLRGKVYLSNLYAEPQCVFTVWILSN